MRGVRFQEHRLSLVGSAAIGRKFGAGEETRRTAIKPEEVVAIDPFEVEQKGEGSTDPNVGKNRSPRVEDQTFGRLRHPGLDDVPDHLAIARGRKVVTVMPAQRFGLDPEIVKAALESFEIDVGLAIVIEPDFVEIP